MNLALNSSEYGGLNRGIRESSTDSVEDSTKGISSTAVFQTREQLEEET
jgi:hypothetical protein